MRFALFDLGSMLRLGVAVHKNNQPRFTVREYISEAPGWTRLAFPSNSVGRSEAPSQRGLLRSGFVSHHPHSRGLFIQIVAPNAPTIMRPVRRGVLLLSSTGLAIVAAGPYRLTLPIRTPTKHLAVQSCCRAHKRSSIIRESCLAAALSRVVGRECHYPCGYMARHYWKR
jgi:hypothetical protein